MINHDLESTPLKIKTNVNIPNGEEESIRVQFYDSSEDIAGFVIIDIRQTTYYMLKYCMVSNWKTFTWDTDTEVIKECTITKESGPIIRIECNGKLIERLVMSNNTCADTRWSSIWSRDVSDLKFLNSDVASDFYFGLAAG